MSTEEHKIEEEIKEVGAAVEKAVEKKDRFLPISILIAAILIGGALVFSSLYHGGGTGAAVTPPAPAIGNQGGAPAPSATTTAAIMQLGTRDAILGSANAPVTIVEYGDYQCPYCAQFFAQTEPSIISNYVNSGKVRMVFRNFAFLGAESTAAAEAAECAEDQNKLWAYHDALYGAKVGDEQKGGTEDDGFYNRALFLKLAGNVGLDIPTFTSCIDSNKYATQVAKEQAAASAAGVGSTPTFYVNGTQILGAEPYASFQAAIESALQS